MQITRTNVTRQNFSAELVGGSSMTATINDGTISVGLVQTDGAKLQVAAMPVGAFAAFLEFAHEVVAQADGIPAAPVDEPAPDPEPEPEGEV